MEDGEEDEGGWGRVGRAVKEVNTCTIISMATYDIPKPAA